MKKSCLLLAALLLLALSPGCAKAPEAPPVEITLSGDALESAVTVDLTELSSKPENVFSGVYSSINNWPTNKLGAASGVTVDAILRSAGVPEGAYTLTFIAGDGYKISLTDQQWRAERYYFPNLDSGDPSGAEVNKLILATTRAKDSADVKDAVPVKPTLIFGQATLSEHNNVAFAEDVVRIEISSAIPAQWAAANCFPAPGDIARGDTVKLEHPEMGLVKLFYTLDGTDPTPDSPTYNPSTYQPDLNAPIKLDSDTVIKVLVTGYGRHDSEIAEFRFTVR